MKFRKMRKPPKIIINNESGGDLRISRNGTAEFHSSYFAVGPREAVRIARWLVRYAKWSSVKDG